MKLTFKLSLAALAMTALSAGSALADTKMAMTNIGRDATPAEVKAWDIDVRPDFKGLPKGSGSVAKGEELWESKCASCHGGFGESNEVFTPLIGGTTKDDIKTGRVKGLEEGKSIVPILNGTQTKVRGVLYTAYRDCQRAIRDERWKLIRYPLVDRTQLFDLSNDPHELTNLADKPEHAAKIAELTELLKREMADHADKSQLTVAEPKPAEWTPPAAGSEPAKQAREKHAAVLKLRHQGISG